MEIGNKQHVQREQIRQPRDTRVIQEMEVEFASYKMSDRTSMETNMQREQDWPVGEETMPWPAEANVVEEVNLLESSNVRRGKAGNSHSTKSNYRLDNAQINKEYSVQKPKIKIIENRQIVSPTNIVEKPSKEWLKVGRRGRIESGSSQNNSLQHRVPPPLLPSQSKSVTRSGGNNFKRRVAKPAVVTITTKTGGVSYADILVKAREKVSLKDIGIQETVIRRALNGAIVIEIPGSQSKQLAGILASRLSEALGEEARVQNPVAMGELRIRGIDLSTSMQEVSDALVSLGECSREDLKVSPISTMRDGMGIAWIVCPMDIALKIAECKQVRLVWTRVRVEFLKKRPIQCFKCWHFGHVKSSCKSDIDRTGACFRCGLMGHSAGNCRISLPRCVVCEDLGKENRHRLGTLRCLANQGLPSGVVQIGKNSFNRSRNVNRQI